MTRTLPAEEGWVDFRGYRTWYRIVGDRTADAHPLLCLHGGPGSTHNYFAPLEALGAERPVVLYDQIGCGQSDRPSDVEWTLDVFRKEVAAVREQLGLEHIHLLGTSWGGMLALEHALSRLGAITSLILSSTLASAEEWQAEAKRLRDALPADIVALYDGHEAAGTYDDPEYARAEEAFAARHFYRGEPRPEIERWKRERNPGVYRAMWGPNEWTVTGALAGWDVRPRLGEIDVPTLVIRGRYDLCTEPIAQTLLDGIPNAREVVFEQSSHTPVLEETERYLAVVGDFIREAERVHQYEDGASEAD